MLISCSYNQQTYSFDLAHPLDISLPLFAGSEAPNAFHIGTLSYAPVRVGSFVGSVAEGGSCNCEDITFNPHGNGTHTECIGHITRERITVNSVLKNFHFVAKLVTVPVEEHNGDLVVSREAVQRVLAPGEAEAVVIRTVPNGEHKRNCQWSGSNPPYVQPEAAAYIRECGILHLLVDLPSMDREDDGGKLLAHRAFWYNGEQPRSQCTITEMVYVPDAVPDALYLLNLQIVSFETDASPSKPLLYAVHSVA